MNDQKVHHVFIVAPLTFAKKNSDRTPILHVTGSNAFRAGRTLSRWADRKWKRANTATFNRFGHDWYNRGADGQRKTMFQTINNFSDISCHSLFAQLCSGGRLWSFVFAVCNYNSIYNSMHIYCKYYEFTYDDVMLSPFVLSC